MLQLGGRVAPRTASATMKEERSPEGCIFDGLTQRIDSRGAVHLGLLPASLHPPAQIGSTFLPQGGL